jgi:carotenoid 1,2-hydratase
MANTIQAPPPPARLLDPATPPGGYTWWYADGLSRDGDYGFTLIVFIGSVFSPYYAWSGRKDPFNHCAVNLALYGRRHARWTMTERGRGDLQAEDSSITIGPSSLHWDGSELIADIAEYAAPLPFPVRGRIRLRPRAVNETAFGLDSAGAHTWRPVAPSADVELEFSEPHIRWRGDAYFDTNRGTTPLDEAFRYWDWSRLQSDEGRTAILYNTEERSGAKRNLALLFRPDGTFETFDPPAESVLRPTPIFRIPRRTRAAAGSHTRLGRTLEDTPFYSRSIIESDLLGARSVGIHESFDGDRLKRTLVRLMLPFRMPRRPIRL